MNKQVLEFVEVNRVLKDYFSVYAVKDRMLFGKIYETFLERFAVIGNGVNAPIFDSTVINTLEAASLLKDFKKTKSIVSDKEEGLYFDIKNKDETYGLIKKADNIDKVIRRLNLKFMGNPQFIEACMDPAGYVKLDNSAICALINKEPVEFTVDGHFVVITGYTICPAVNEFTNLYIKFMKDISIEDGDESKYYFVIKEEIYKDYKKASKGVTHLLDMYTLIAYGADCF